MVRVRQPGLLLGEWACLGALGHGRRHGFAIAKRLGHDGDLGRVWTLSRPLTYRSLGVLTELGMVRPVVEEAGAGPNRTLLAVSPKGRTALHEWLDVPVDHPRDVRTELLLKLLLRDELGHPPMPFLGAQRAIFAAQHAERSAELAADASRHDPVLRWRVESALAAVRFLDALIALDRSDPRDPSRHPGIAPGAT